MSVDLKHSTASFAPPTADVPYRFPALSTIKPPNGSLPSVVAPAKECRMLSEPAALILKTVPSSFAPPKEVVPYRFPALS